jgi:hemerythrin
MALMQWTEALSVHIAEIDKQHQRLITLINQLDDAIHVGNDHDVLGAVLEELLDYTRTHFRYEENLLKTNGYPELEAHKAEHDSLTEKVVFLGDYFKRGENLNTVQIMQFLKIWLEEHIMGVDRTYAEYLNAKGIF